MWVSAQRVWSGRSLGRVNPVKQSSQDICSMLFDTCQLIWEAAARTLLKLIELRLKTLSVSVIAPFLLLAVPAPPVLADVDPLM